MRLNLTKRPEPITRFWRNVRKGDGCWEWTAGMSNTNGYGVFTTPYNPHQSAHRFAWVIHNGPIPEGLHVCHHCDNRKCVRPDHLFLGTAKDNTHDMIRKGRQAVGERAGQSKLTTQQVAEMRSLYKGRRKAGPTHQTFADRYNINLRTVGDILRGNTYKGV